MIMEYLKARRKLGTNERHGKERNRGRIIAKTKYI